LGTQGKIFISYRREDAPGDARGICDRLGRSFGEANVFMDVNRLLAGQRFDRELDKALSKCDVLIAVIGSRWMEFLSDYAQSGKRDYVRDEIAAALKRDIIVIPVMIGREAHLPPLPPAENLPENIRELVLYQKHNIAHETFGRDVADLIAAIKAVLGSRRRGPRPSQTIAVTGACALVLTGALLGYWMDIIPRIRSSIPQSSTGTNDTTLSIASDESARKTAANEAARRAAEEVQRQAEADAKAAKEAAELKAAADAAAKKKAAVERAKATEKPALQAKIEEAARVAGVVIETSEIGKETKGDGPHVSTACAGSSTRVEAMSSRIARTLSQAEECGLEPKDLFRECQNCPDMVVVPAGEVLMGSSRADIDNGLAAANEGPQHKVVIKQPLAIGRFEVTRDQFAEFVNGSGYKPGDHCFTFEQNIPQDRANRSFLNPGYVQEGNHPAVCVSWADAKAYVAWLSQTTGKSYRLLSEAEFEYAARAGSKSRFGPGNDPDEICKFANGADQAAKNAGLPGDIPYMSCSDGYPFTAPVGSLAPNAFGLYDLIGNVWEWTEDCYYRDYATARADSAAHLNATCSTRAVRGGDWFSTEASLRPAVRAEANADARHDDIGFRVARALGN
jgi:formylglycine-generating enzyme required for sulfatase activity